MDDLKFNKAAAGFLMAGLIALGGYKIAEILVPHQELAENSYPIQITEQVASSSTGAAPVGPEPILAMLADADIAAGQKVAKKCTACHVFDKGGQNKVGLPYGTSLMKVRVKLMAMRILKHWPGLAANGIISL